MSSFIEAALNTDCFLGFGYIGFIQKKEVAIKEEYSALRIGAPKHLINQ